ncbi:MAG: alpha-1,2-fucosyltransferase [Patescibacteria group bacterium]
MVTSKIVGGLGNQMFQYAIGKRMADDLKQDFVIDIEDFKTYRRHYALDRFQITTPSLDPAKAASFRKYEGRVSLWRSLEGLKPIVNRSYRLEALEHYFKYHPEYIQPHPKGKDVYLNGYWQHPDYFAPIRNTLLSEFRLTPQQQIQDPQLLRILSENETVAVHFRRGEDQLTKSLYGVPPMSYYAQAVRTIAERRGSARLHLLIFSNDIEWVKQNFQPDMPTTYVSGAFGLNDEQEFELMARSTHQVIANSTFSWWAAWLNDNPGRIVVAPTTWLNDPRFDTRGLYLKDWLIF